MPAIPNYIEKAGLVDSPVQYVWNDADPGSLFLPDQRLGNQIAKISDRGVVALSCGFATWIAARLIKQVNDSVLFQEIEAVWAGINDWRYLGSLNHSRIAPKKEQWQGPLRGPVHSAFYLLSDVVRRARKSSYSAEASSCLSKLATHVLSDPKPFLHWRKFVMDRLMRFYPFDQDARLGPPVPQEVLNTDFDFQPDMAKELLSNFLRSLDYEKNPFLRSPEEMIQDGFEGTPYTF